jgi:hypothetical protein
MAKLKFTIDIPSRVGHAPASNQWTYHHVQPWRYYYVAGFILVKLVKYKLFTTGEDRSIGKTQGVNIKPVLTTEKAKVPTQDKDLKKAIAAEFGAEATGFAFDEDYTMLSLLNTSEAMHGPGAANAIFTRINADSEISPASLAELQTNPVWGGFEGMKPDQRLDDPGSTPEPRKPWGAPGPWWTALTNLTTRLHAVAPKVENGANKKVDVTLETTSCNNLLETLTALTAFGVYAFQSTDWEYVVTNAVKPWVFITAGIPGAAERALASKVFRLKTAAPGGGAHVAYGAAPVTVPPTAKCVRNAADMQQLMFLNG